MQRLRDCRCRNSAGGADQQLNRARTRPPSILIRGLIDETPALCDLDVVAYAHGRPKENPGPRGAGASAPRSGWTRGFGACPGRDPPRPGRRFYLCRARSIARRGGKGSGKGNIIRVGACAGAGGVEPASYTCKIDRRVPGRRILVPIGEFFVGAAVEVGAP